MPAKCERNKGQRHREREGGIEKETEGRGSKEGGRVARQRFSLVWASDLNQYFRF